MSSPTRTRSEHLLDHPDTTRSPRPRTTKAVPLTFGSGGRLATTLRTHRRTPTPPGFHQIPATTDTDLAPLPQLPHLEMVLQTIGELCTLNTALRLRLQQ